MRLALPCAALWLALVSSVAADAAETAPAERHQPRSVTELRLPEYQAEAMATDLPARDVVIGEDRVLWAIGKTALWRWELTTNRLKRWPLHEKKEDRTTLQRLGTDGLSIFAASGSTLYQLQPAQGRLFRYGIPLGAPKARVFAFAGKADDFWMVHAGGVLQFDRYGKRLETRRTLAPLDPKDKIAFDSAQRRLWIARGAQLLKVDLGGEAKEPTPAPAAVVALKAKHRFLDVQIAGPDLIAHTAYTVLRLDPETGKVKQSVPVEGRRKLQRMAASEAVHAYLFDDRLLEVFQIERRTASRFRLPLDESEQAGRLRLSGDTVALLVDGRPRVFVLNGYK